MVYGHESYWAYPFLGQPEAQWVRFDNCRDDGRRQGVAVEQVDLCCLDPAYYSDPWYLYHDLNWNAFRHLHT